MNAIREKALQQMNPGGDCGTGLWGGSREIHVSLQCRDGLDALASRLKVDSLQIAGKVIRSYLDFVERHQDLAQGQPLFEDCLAVLGFVDPKQPLIERLDRVCETYNLLPAQVISQAIKVYLDYASRQKGELAPLVEAYPGDIGPENIACLLSRPTDSARDLFHQTVATFPELPFEAAVERAKGLLGMVMPHPGFEKERVALEMIVEGADRLK